MHQDRRHFLKRTGLLFGASLLPAHRWLSALLAQDTANMELLRRNVGIFTERGGTIGWLISEQGLVVVDTQFPEQAGHLLERIRERSGRRIDLLINTHHHGDHTGGNIAFRGLADKVVGHVNCRANQERVAKERKAEDGQLYADTTFEDRWTQRVGDEIVTARYFGPAHTDGDAVIHFENANVAHVGDLMFNRRYPFIDRSAGASISGWIDVLRSIRREYDNDTLFIFGHALENNPVTGSKDDLKAFEKYLGSLLKFVRREVKAGKSKEEILKATAIPKGGPWQGQGIERSLQAAYEEVTG
jgi:glyoxylase-like metal-dependent hydrolase (beta-lactamase superfamily II)